MSWKCNKGETKHFDFVCNAVAMGIKDLNIKFDIPVIFGVLTDNNIEQAINRSGGKLGNKGVEVCSNCYKNGRFKSKINI